MEASDLRNIREDEFYRVIKAITVGFSKNYSIPGVAMAFIDNKKLTYELTYGFADKIEKKEMKADTIFQAASISKSFTAWGIMKLVQDGKVSLDIPVDNYLKSWHLPESEYNKGVTVRRILNHTAGLSVHGYKGNLPQNIRGSIIESLNGEPFRKNKVKVIKEPGKVAMYSGGGYTVLQLLIQEITKMSFSEYMKEEILGPIGMTKSTFDYEKCMKEDLSKCYGYFGGSKPNYVFVEKAAAGLYTTLNDMVKFVLETLNGINNDTKVLSHENLSLMLSRVNREIPYGLGYHLINMGKNKIIMNHGINRGWRSRFMILPNTNDGMIILTNSDCGENLIKEVSLKWLQWKVGEVSDFYKKKLYLNKSSKYIDLLNTWLEYICL